MGAGYGHDSSSRIDDIVLAPPGSGPDAEYDAFEYDSRRLGRVNTAPKLGPGFGRPSFDWRGAPLKPPGCGAGKVYKLPEPEVYLPRGPRTPRWDPANPRFAKTRQMPTDAQYTLPEARVYLPCTGMGGTRLGPGLGKGVGPRIDPSSYRLGHGADRLYDIPPYRHQSSERDDKRSCRLSSALSLSARVLCDDTAAFERCVRVRDAQGAPHQGRRQIRLHLLRAARRPPRGRLTTAHRAA